MVKRGGAEEISLMGSGKGAVGQTAELLSGIAYISYVLVGIALFALGIVYHSQIEDPNSSAPNRYRSHALRSGADRVLPTACLVAAAQQSRS